MTRTTPHNIAPREWNFSSEASIFKSKKNNVNAWFGPPAEHRGGLCEVSTTHVLSTELHGAVVDPVVEGLGDGMMEGEKE